MLADEYNVHASLAGRDRLDAIQLEGCHSTKTLMTLNTQVGTRIPLAGTATGHALLAALPAVPLEPVEFATSANAPMLAPPNWDI